MVHSPSPDLTRFQFSYYGRDAHLFLMRPIAKEIVDGFVDSRLHTDTDSYTNCGICGYRS